MAVPKRKISKTRRDKRRSHHHAEANTLVPCAHCKQMKVSHRVCPHCGYYAGVEVIEQKD
jgi:large subunit ribosomal protein L32